MLKKYLPQSEFGKNIVTLTSGTTISQIIPLIVTPILSRIYEANDFGIFAVYLSIALIFAVLATGRYELAILLPEKRSEAVNILAFALLIAISWVIITTISIPFLTEPLRVWSNNHEVINWIYLLPISILLMGMNQSFGYWYNRHKRYKGLSINKITQSSATAGIKLGYGLFQQNPFGLIIGNIIGFAVACVMYVQNFIKHDAELIREVRWSRMKFQAKRYIKFPKYDMGSGLLYTFSTQVPILMLAYFFNAAVVGWYSLAHTILKMPMSFIGNSIGQVFFQHSSSIKEDKERFSSTTFSLYKKLFWIGILPMALVGGFGDYLFGFVLGKDWVVAGTYAQYLAPWLLFVFLSSPISHILNVLEKQQINLLFNFIVIILRVGVLFVGGLYFKDATITVMLFGAVSLAAWGFLTLLVLKLAEVNLYKVLIFTLPKIALAIFLAFMLRWLIF